MLKSRLSFGSPSSQATRRLVFTRLGHPVPPRLTRRIGEQRASIVTTRRSNGGEGEAQLKMKNGVWALFYDNMWA
jgi:hypothetical protein